jgi:hypothetical protein
MPDETADIVDTGADEKFRIHVPNPDTELQMGLTDNKFVGIFARVAYGGVFVGAGGFPFGIPSPSSTYADFRKSQVTIALGVNGIVTINNVIKLLGYGGGAGKWEMIGGAVATGLTLGCAATAIASGALDDWSGPGTVSMYGDVGVSVASPVSVGATGGISATITGGVAASVNAVGLASVNAISASVNGLYSGSTTGQFAYVIGDASTVVATRRGDMHIEGQTVFIGKPSGNPVTGTLQELGAKPGYAYMTLNNLLFERGQKATSRVEIKADDNILLEPGKSLDKFAGAPTKVNVAKDSVRVETKGTALVLNEKDMTLHVGGAIVQLGSAGLKLLNAAVPIKETAGQALAAAEVAWKEGRNAVIKAKEAADLGAWTAIVGALSFTVSAIPAAIGAAALEKKVSGLGLLGIPIAAVGGGIGAVATYALMQRAAQEVATEATVKARKLADDTYKTALKAAVTGETTVIEAQSKLPTNPTIEITSTGVEIKVGTSKIAVTAAGVEISGPLVKVTGTLPVQINSTNLTVLP